MAGHPRAFMVAGAGIAADILIILKIFAGSGEFVSAARRLNERTLQEQSANSGVLSVCLGPGEG
jgi:hypothetical protein